MGVRTWVANVLVPPGAPPVEDSYRYSFSDWVNEAITYSFHGNGYVLPVTQPPSMGEAIGNDFPAYVSRIYKRSAPVFAVIQTRINLLSEARFIFRNLSTKDLFGSPALAILEHPWPNGTSGELWARMEQDASLAGNCYLYIPRSGDRLRRLSPEKVSIALASSAARAEDVTDLNSEVLGYLYFPDGYARPDSGIALTVDEVVHWSPIPDPSASFRGMSWVQSVVHEVQTDLAATDAKLRFFENGMTPNLVVKFPPEVLTKEHFENLRDSMESTHAGSRNAYKTLYLAAGADATVVGADIKSAGLKDVQGGDETRICAAGRVPPVIVGLSEGLQSATYSNYGQARRQFADGWARPTWRSACAALSKAVAVPAGCELWYDDRSIAFLREDAKEAADTITTHMSAIVTAVNGGFDAVSAVKAVTSGDLALLKHTDLVSVQLQPPGTVSAPAPAPTTNGATAPKAVGVGGSPPAKP